MIKIVIGQTTFCCRVDVAGTISMSGYIFANLSLALYSSNPATKHHYHYHPGKFIFQQQQLTWKGNSSAPACFRLKYFLNLNKFVDPSRPVYSKSDASWRHLTLVLWLIYEFYKFWAQEEKMIELFL